MLKNFLYLCIMKKEDLDFFKSLLSVPSNTGQEDLIIDYLSDYLYSKDYNFYLDDMSNIYITKGKTEFYPCFVAHLDTVHHMSNILVKEEKHPNDHGEYKDALTN